jgi:hypothetical protein
MDLNQNSTFEQPDSGIFIGVIADVVDLYGVKTNFGEKNKVRIVFVLDKNNSQGKPYHQYFSKNASMHEKSDLYKAVRAILGTNPPVVQNTEQLAQLLIGKAVQLFIMKEPNAQGKEFSNIKGINALPPGAAIPKIPTDFVRAKDKSVPQAQPAVQPAASFTGQYTPPAPPAAQTTNASF